MNLNELLPEVARNGGCLEVESGKLHYRGPRRGLTPALRHAIGEQKDELLSVLKGSASFWPPNDAAELVFKWNNLDRPRIPLFPGVIIANLESWLCSNWPENLVADQVAGVRHFLWESLPGAEVPKENLILDEWRDTAIPIWQERLMQATKSGHPDMIKKARWMLREILLDPEYEESINSAPVVYQKHGLRTGRQEAVRIRPRRSNPFWLNQYQSWWPDLRSYRTTIPIAFLGERNWHSEHC